MSTGSIACAARTARRSPAAPCPTACRARAFGPRLHAALSVLTGAYRLSKRQVAQLGSDLLGLTISVGMIAKLERITAEVLEQPVAELAEAVKTAEAANIDETGWREAHLKAWLWVVVTSVGVVFRIARSRAGAVAADLLGEEPKPIVISDRFPGYEWIKLKSRQVCWAHLRRDFQAMIDRDGDGAEVGRQLLWQSNKLFESWHKVRDGTIQRSTFLQTVAWLRPMVRSSLERGSRCACAEDGGDVRRVAAPLGLPVDLHPGRGRRADEQRGRARACGTP